MKMLESFTLYQNCNFLPSAIVLPSSVNCIFLPASSMFYYVSDMSNCIVWLSPAAIPNRFPPSAVGSAWPRCEEGAGAESWSPVSESTHTSSWEGRPFKPVTKFRQFRIFSRPGRSQGLLYKQPRNSFIHSVSKSVFSSHSFTAPPRPNG
jgi:hypothetical protein